jgi:hypothetical protein
MAEGAQAMHMDQVALLGLNTQPLRRPIGQEPRNQWFLALLRLFHFEASAVTTLTDADRHYAHRQTSLNR